jgi:hypothetical protein
LFWSLTWCLAGARFSRPWSYPTDHRSATVDRATGSHSAKQEWGSSDYVCFKIDEKRMVTHEHNPVSFDVESGKVSLDFKPW